MLGVAWRCLQPRVRLLGRGLPVVQDMRRLCVWLEVIKRMRRLCALLLEADVRQEAASLALWVLEQDKQGMEEASGVVFVEMRDAKGGGACRGVRKAR